MKTKQNVLLFNFERGDKLSVAAFNTLALKVYQKFNNLIPADVAILTTAQFRGEIWAKNLLYPNYCGIMSSDLTMPTCDVTNSNYGLTDTMCRKLIREADEILKYLEEV